MQVVEVTPVLSTDIYADNDVLFVATTVPFAPGGSVARKLTSITAIDAADQGTEIELVFSQGSITLGTINDVVSISDADAANILGTVIIGNSTDNPYCDLVGAQCVTKSGINLVLQPDDGLYIAGIVRSGTPTYAASSLRIRLGFEDA